MSAGGAGCPPAGRRVVVNGQLVSPKSVSEWYQLRVQWAAELRSHVAPDLMKTWHGTWKDPRS